MANPNPTVRRASEKGSHIINKVRHHVLKSFEILEMDDKESLTDIMVRTFREQPLRYLEVAAKYCPIEKQVNVHMSLSLEQISDNELIELVRGETIEHEDSDSNADIPGLEHDTEHNSDNPCQDIPTFITKP